MWQVLVSDEGTITLVFQHILEVLSFSLPYQEKPKGNKVVRTETDVPKAVSVAHYMCSDYDDNVVLFLCVCVCVCVRVLRPAKP